MSEQKTEQKHTPGPWKAFTEPKFSGWWSVCDSGERELGSGDGGFEEANARLIAAAPELLEALQAFADEIVPNNQNDPMWVNARSAIAKATGEQP